MNTFPKAVIHAARAALLLLILMGTGMAPVQAKPAPPEEGGGPVFGWKVQSGVVDNPRPNADGITLTSGGTVATAIKGGLPLQSGQEPHIPIVLEGCGDPGATSVRFTIDGSALKAGSCRVETAVVPGVHHVTMTVAGKTSSVTTTHRIDVVHHTIIGMGDSYASGEGIEPDGGWANSNCRRSAASPQARAAKALEDSDPHSTVTFIFLACSGATVEQYPGKEGPAGGGMLDFQLKPPGDEPPPPQLVEARRLSRGLTVNRILLSIGGNDIGFPTIVETCAKVQDCPFEDTWRGQLHQTVQNDLARLPVKYAKLANAMLEYGLVDFAGQVLHTQYPWVGTTVAKGVDTLKSPSGSRYCDNALSGIPPFFNGVSDNEFKWATEIVQDGDPSELESYDYDFDSGQVLSMPLPVKVLGLNAVIRSAHSGFTPILGAEELFDGHGYCAPDETRWVVQASDFGITHHSFNGWFVNNRSAPMHPNADGQARWGKLIGDSLIAGIDDVIGGSSKRVLVFGPGEHGDNQEGLYVKTILEPAGYSVDVATVLPGDLAPYGSVWYFDAYSSLSSEDTSRLITFAKAGRGVFLTGERPCCEALNQSVSFLVNQLLTVPAVSIGGQGDICCDPFPVNRNVVGQLASRPFSLSSWDPQAAGGLANVAPTNVFAGNGSNAAAAAWDGSTVVGGGRIVVFMDVNWIQDAYRDSSTAPLIVQNLALFLNDLPETLVSPVARATDAESPRAKSPALPSRAAAAAR